MRRAILSTVLFLAACTSPVPMGTVDPTPFRDASWGMTQVQVRARESSNQVIEISGERATYADRVLGMVCIVHYQFDNGRLVAGGYTVREQHERNLGRVEDYLRFQKALTQEYGEAEEATIWFNSLYEHDYVNWGLAVEAGHVVFRNTWQTDDTSIALSLGGGGRELAVRVDYANKVWSESEEWKRRERDSQKL